MVLSPRIPCRYVNSLTRSVFYPLPQAKTNEFGFRRRHSYFSRHFRLRPRFARVQSQYGVPIYPFAVLSRHFQTLDRGSFRLARAPLRPGSTGHFRAPSPEMSTAIFKNSESHETRSAAFGRNQKAFFALGATSRFVCQTPRNTPILSNHPGPSLSLLAACYALNAISA